MDTRARVALVCVPVLLLSSFMANSAGATDPAPAPFDNDAEECLEAAPAAASVAGVTDDGREIVLDIHLVLDGISTGRAAEVIEQARYAYDPLNITLRATYQEVSFPPQRVEKEFATDAEPVPVSDASYLFQKTKEAVGGVRPPGSDVVYLLTDDAITGTTAGVADCIGGVRYANRAFGIGEEEDDGPPSTLAFCCTLTTAKVAAHEIAHLMGAHHHYANCAEGAATKLDDPHLGTCTMMFNDVGLVNLRFSVLEAAVVRGHAIEFADRAPDAETPQPQPTQEPQPQPTQEPQPEQTASPAPEPEETQGPDPEPEESDADAEPVTHLRAVDLKLARHLVARGRVKAGDANSCYEFVSVVLQRRSSSGWKRVASRATRADGSFRIKLADKPGRYRAVVRRLGSENEDGIFTCSAAASPPIRHRHHR